MIYKSVSEVVEALGAELSMATYTKPGTQFTYVPWTESKKLLDEVFGIFGWSTTEPRVLFAPLSDQGKASGVYTVSFGLRVMAVDDETGQYLDKLLPCVGQGVSYGADDNSAKSAMSDALSRGVKMLGRAFGFELYEKTGTGAGQTQQDAPRTRSSNGSADRRPSDKQAGILRNKLHWSDEQIAAAPFAEWKGAIDDHFASQGEWH